MHKLGVFLENDTDFHDEVPFRYDNVYSREQTTGPERLVIAPREAHIDILIDLAATWQSDYWLLYILLVSRCGKEPSRYQSPAELDFEKLKEFLTEFGSFLSTDGRHHFWIGSTQNEGMLIYDQHDVIYAYGNLDEYEARLVRRGLTIGEVSFPAPHLHCYNQENDEHEIGLLNYFDWMQSPLQDGDEY